MITIAHLLVAAVAMSNSSNSTYKTHPEYKVKAAFIYNFIQFVSWPESSFGKGDPIILRIAGDFKHVDAVKVLSQKTTAMRHNGDKEIKKKCTSHQIKVEKWDTSAKDNSCHILFIARGAEAMLPDIMADLKNKSVLVISDSDVALGNGAMIAFYIANSQVRFKIDPDAVASKNIKISSRLLRLATIVKPGAGMEDDR